MKNNYTQSTWIKPDVALENQLRPPSLDDFIGQEQLKQRLKISIGASKKEETFFPIVFFTDRQVLEKQLLQASFLMKWELK